MSRFTRNPNQTHCMSMKRVMGYPEHTQHNTLHYNKYHALKDIFMQIASWGQMK